MGNSEMGNSEVNCHPNNSSKWCSVNYSRVLKQADGMKVLCATH